MKYTVKKSEKSTVTIVFDLEKDDVEKHRKKAADDISKDLDIKGFRAGHIPLNVLEEHVDKKFINARAQELAVQMAYAEAVTTEKLHVVAAPKIKFISDTTKLEDGMKFEAEVAILPEVKVKDYKSIKIPKEEPKVDKKEVEEVIADMKKYVTEWKDVEREVKKGDRVEIDFEGFEAKEKKDAEAKAIPGTESKNHPVIVGEGSLVPGFEGNLEGMKKDEKKEFELTFPKEYHNKEFQGKKVLFKVELKRIEEGKVQDLNEDFVEKVTGKKMPVEDFKKDIEKNIKARKEQQASADRENKYLEELIKKTELDVPEAMLDEEVHFMLEDIKHDLAQKGVTDFNQFLEQSKTSLEDLQKKYRPEAEKRIKIRLALTHLLEEEKIEVTDKEADEEIKKLEAFGQKIDNPDEKKTQIKNKMLLKKLFDKVLG
ncbi:trigger factor [Candidatus Peregrinibacteria bacterium]|jgi:trigger factor|nr:trigger factor [Candidatus Peregrinibacteria bacterium]